MMRGMWAIQLLMLVILPVCAYSQVPDKANAGLNDGHIAAVFLQINNLDIDHARLMHHPGVTGSVREISEMILAEHVPIRDEFVALLSSLGIQPDLPDAYTQYWDERGFKERLRSASGHGGDKLYMEYEYTFSKKAVALIESQLIPACENGQLKSFLMGSLPKLKNHLSHIAMYHNGEKGKHRKGMTHTHP